MSAKTDRTTGASSASGRTAEDSIETGNQLAESAFPVVGVGASAGGLEALSALLRALPARTGMAVVMVLHLDPAQESMLASILGRSSQMPVSEAAHGMRVESDHVYVIPPNVEMRLIGGVIALQERAPAPAHVLPIDTLMASLAEEYANLAIGVVLSGTGTDGVLGLAAIKAAGGLTFAQDPTTAEFDGMPKAATESGVVDEALDIAGIAAELVRLGKHPDLRVRLAETEVPSDRDEESFTQILLLVRKATGLDLSSYRKTTLLRRISRRMLLEGVHGMRDYFRLLQEQPSKVEALYRDVLVNVTEFFRHPDALDALQSEVFPQILEHREPDVPIRIWVPGCSKGQEAYSILITLVELLDGKASTPEIQMFASDVNAHDVEFARVGLYPEGIAREVTPERLASFFTRVAGGYQINREIREMCVFAVHDVTKDPPFSKLDLVSFRNVLIYMENPLQRQVLRILHYALVPGGFLLLGSSESIGSEDALFTVIDKKHRIFRRNPGPGKLISSLAPSAGRVAFSGVRNQRLEVAPEFDVLAAVEKVVQGGYQPPGILVNEGLDILQFRGHVAPYLEPTDGRADLKLPHMIASGLSLTVEAVVRQAAKTKTAAKRHWTAPGGDATRRKIEVDAVPIISPTGDAYYLVLFKEPHTEAPESGSETEQKGERDLGRSEASDLHRELDETREQLEAVVSERETATTDLRVVSEKFQSSNEDLRTINEEFQTAQEELQSTNEELTTLNDELRTRNSDLGRLTDDLNNVIQNVEIPILILDADLCIRRFTPQAEKIVNIMPTDIGRPITDLNLKFDVPDFKERITESLQPGAESQTEVRSGDGRWHSMRIRPYETSNGIIAGVVIAFIDVDELKRSTQAAEAARDHAEAVVETVRQPLLTLGPDLTVREANHAFYQTFAVSIKETIGKHLYELGAGQWDFAELRSLLERILLDGQGFADLEVERDFTRIGHRAMVLYARRVREEQGPPSILLAIDDVTELRHSERLSTTLNNISITIGSTLEFGQILERVLKESTEGLGAESAVALLRQDGTWVTENVYGLPRDLVGQNFGEQGTSLDVTSSETGEPVMLDDAEAARFGSHFGVASDDGSVLVVPLLLREEDIGMVSFHFHPRVANLGVAEVNFARRLGTLLSLALENSKLFSTQRAIADTLQEALLSVPPRIPGIDFGYLYRSSTTAAAVGGDFYDLFELDGGRVGVLVGDISGKGVRAAVLAALVKNTIRALAYENDSPAVVISKANAAIFKTTPTSIFVTLLFCIIDTASGRLVYCSAGHTRGVMKKRDADVAMFDIGSPLAGAFEFTKFEDGETTMVKGDVLVLYTDGVTEARRNGELFGEQRLTEFVRQMETMPTKDVPQTIFDEVLGYTGGTLSDDTAIISVSIRDET